jgi:hypothetical protein
MKNNKNPELSLSIRNSEGDRFLEELAEEDKILKGGAEYVERS